MQQDQRLAGKVAVVTGAARGMGASHAAGMVAAGAKVIVADVLVDEGVAIAKELGDAALFVELDVTNETAWKNTVTVAIERFGGVDILVNNAGVIDLTPLVSQTLEMYQRVIAVNQIGPFLGMREVAPAMARRGGGSIVNVSSVAGLTGSPMNLTYGASKYAVRGMTKCAALELASAGIRVNSIHPGFVRTPMIDLPGVNLGDVAAGVVPLGRAAEVEEITELVLFLTSSASGYCTGAEFVIDGGFTAGTVLPGMSEAAAFALQARLEADDHDSVASVHGS